MPGEWRAPARWRGDVGTRPGWLVTIGGYVTEQAGTQGIELILWLTARATLGAVRQVAATYHVPISNTAAGMMLLEPTA